MTHGLSIPKDQMDEFCRRWKVAELAVHGRAKVHEDADLGLFVRFDPTANWNLLDRMEMQRELEKLSGTAVSIHSRHGETVRRGRSRGMRVVYDA